MKPFITLFISILCSLYVSGQMVNDDEAFFNYTYDKALIKKNKIKTMTRGSTFSDGKSMGTATYYFNKEGLLTKMIIADSTGIAEREFLFMANPQQDLIERIMNDQKYKLTDTVTFYKTYRANKLISDSSGNMPLRTEYTYHPRGTNFNTMTIYPHFGPGSIQRRTTTQAIDSKKRITNITEIAYLSEHDSTGTVFSNRDVLYNRKGKREKEEKKIESSNEWMNNKGSIQYRYDNKGNLTHILRTHGASYVYTYNKKGMITSRKMYMKLEYDEFLEEETKVGSLHTYSYTYSH